MKPKSAVSVTVVLPTPEEIAERIERDASRTFTEQQAAHHEVLGWATNGRWDDGLFVQGLARCRAFIKRRVPCVGRALLEIRELAGVAPENVAPFTKSDSPISTDVLGAFLEHSWRPDRAAAAAELMRDYIRAGYFDVNAMMRPAMNSGAAQVKLPAIEVAAFGERFDQMFVLLEMGALHQHGEYDLLSTLDLLNLDNRQEIGVRINHTLMTRHISPSPSALPIASPTSLSGTAAPEPELARPASARSRRAGI